MPVAVHTPPPSFHPVLLAPRLPAVSAACAAAAAAAAPVVLPPAPGWAELAPLRGRLVQFARRRLLDPSLAEDLVHDVFEAVITGRAQFGGKSSLGTWLVGVLKHKIVDLVRQRSGHVSLDASDDDGEGAGPGTELVCPQPGPSVVAEQRQLLRRTLRRIEELPDNLKRVVELRVLQDDSSEAVCRALSISEQNLFVRLHRARKALLAAA
jgi:RNA polymerase sigma-70 factor (ECF subfamily)